MVFPNIFTLSKGQAVSTTSVKRSPRLASPRDRMAAFFIDLISILSPVLVLILAPLKRKITMSSIYGTSEEVWLWMGIGCVICVCVTILYQTIFIHLFGATVGKMFFGIRVVNVWNREKLTIGQSFLRSLFWCLSVLLLCIPALTIYSDRNRRALYEKISDSISLTKLKVGVLGPKRFERTFVRGLYSGVVTAFSIFVFYQIYHFVIYIEQYKSPQLVAEKLSEECGIDFEQFKLSGTKATFDDAMSLFAAGLMDQDCMEWVVSQEYAMNGESTHTLFAKTILYQDYPELRKEYVEKLCGSAPTSIQCGFIQSFASNRNVDQISEQIELMSGIDRNNRYLVWFYLQELANREDFIRLGDLERGLPYNPSLGDFLFTIRSKYTWWNTRSAESLILGTAVESIPNKFSQKLVGWICQQNLQNGCEAALDSCNLFNELTSETKELSDGQLIAKVKWNMCEANKSGNLALYMENSGARRSLVNALALKKRSPLESKALFMEILSDESSGEEIKTEALSQYMEWADVKNLAGLLKNWEKRKHSLLWEKVGMKMLTLADRHQMESETKRIFHFLSPYLSIDPNFIRIGKKINVPDTLEMRAPASQEEK